MKIFHKTSDLQNDLNLLRKEGKIIGFTPTMGALHEGHLSLINESNLACDISVCSIFVNPTQFNNQGDLINYPRKEEEDIEKLKSVSCDILFLPSVEEIYPQENEKYNPPVKGKIVEVLEGEFRPGHFNGMMQVVERFLRIIEPNKIFMGLKDYQQYLLVHKMSKVLNLDVEVCGVPTEREADGLAMSSRNLRLKPLDRAKASAIYEALNTVKEKVNDLPKVDLESIGAKIIEEKIGNKPQYFSIVDANTLLDPTSNTEVLVALTAVFVGEVRLIDNLQLN
jgi:pantoate--beta-alanine ligase